MVDSKSAMRKEFEVIVEQWTGRNMDYHRAGKTTGLEFAWNCYQVGAAYADALRAELATAQSLLLKANELLAKNATNGPLPRKYAPLRRRINAALAAPAKRSP